MKIKRLTIAFLVLCFKLFTVSAALQWTPDLDNGSFQNPILYADYSDPDMIRVGDDYYMVSSSFNCMPGIPILHSKDMVNWEIINHVYQRLPLARYDKPVHGQGCWAPSIRYHDGKFYVYFCTPYDGLFVAVTDHPSHEWELTHMLKVEYWEDPCPLWDDDGNAYLVRSKLCGNDLILHRMSDDGKSLLDNGTLIYQDIENDPTIEGPKFIKKDGYYYILAPAGGVTAGWQTALRSKNIYGPYERKTVLHQGNTAINGPHQGGLVETKKGEWWFAHFQELKPTGRIVHLNPVVWEDGWPMMGKDINKDGIGEPMMEMPLPQIDGQHAVKVPQTSDEFDSDKLGLQWQWHANPQDAWYSLLDQKGSLRLNAVQHLTQKGNLYHAPNLLLQKFASPAFTATTKMSFKGSLEGERSGLIVMGRKWAYIAVVKEANGLKVGMYRDENHKCNINTREVESVSLDTETVFLRMKKDKENMCYFEYSLTGDDYVSLGDGFRAKEGVWIGAKVGLFFSNPNMTKSQSYADFDWFRVE